MVIPFQNENLCAEVIKPNEESEVSGTQTVYGADRYAKYTLQIVCSVPDLIAVLDSQNGASIGTQDYRYGLRVTVIGLACDPRWASAEGLEIGGPEAFGYVVTKLYMSNKLNSDNFNHH